MNKRQIGTEYEERACTYLRDNGYSVLDRNFRTKNGEIDIIAIKDKTIVFIEVKYRANKYYGYSVEAVTPHKQKVIYRVAEGYLAMHKEYWGSPSRFDVIAFDNDKLSHIQNAFGGM